MKRVPKRTTVDMSTKLGRLEFSSPVFTASGCAAAGKELDQFIDITTIGAVVTKSVMLNPRSGRATPRMAETPSGMLNGIGLQGPGIDDFIQNDLSWLSQKGAKTIVSIAGNNVDYVFAPLISSVTMIREGKVVALAVSSEKRAVAFPNIATMAEEGYPQGQFNFWIGMLAPAQTPKAILDKMNDEINFIVDLPDVRDRFEKLGALPFKMKPAAFDKFIQEEAVTLGEVMKASGAKLD